MSSVEEVHLYKGHMGYPHTLGHPIHWCGTGKHMAFKCLFVDFQHYFSIVDKACEAFALIFIRITLTNATKEYEIHY